MHLITGGTYVKIDREGNYSTNVRFNGLASWKDDTYTKTVTVRELNVANGACALNQFEITQINYETEYAIIKFHCSAIHGGSPFVDKVTISVDIEGSRYRINDEPAFEKLEHWHVGKKVFPDGFYYLNVEDPYQAFDTEVVPWAVAETVQNFNWVNQNTAELEPLIGCKKGSIPKTSDIPLFTSNRIGNFYVWYSYEDNGVIVDDGITQIKLDNTKDLWRIGIVLVGHGGDGGPNIHKEWGEGSDTIDLVFPGGGGSGAETVEAILSLINIVESKSADGSRFYEVEYPKFRVSLPATHTDFEQRGDDNNPQPQYENAKVYLAGAFYRPIDSDAAYYTTYGSNPPLLFEAYSGRNGDVYHGHIKFINTNKNNREEDYEGTQPVFGGGLDNNGDKINHIIGEDDTHWYFITHTYAGKSGGWCKHIRSDVDDGESRDSETGAPSTTLTIEFLKDDYHKTQFTNEALDVYGTLKKLIDEDGNWRLVLPGGNSYGQGAHFNDNNDGVGIPKWVLPGIGGGGFSWADQRQDGLGQYGFHGYPWVNDEGDPRNPPHENAIAGLFGGRAYFALYY